MAVGVKVEDLRNYIESNISGTKPQKDVMSFMLTMVRSYFNEMDLTDDLRKCLNVYVSHLRKNFYRLSIEFIDYKDNTVYISCCSKHEDFINVNFEVKPCNRLKRNPEYTIKNFTINYPIGLEDIRKALAFFKERLNAVEESKRKREEDAYLLYKHIRQSFPDWDETTRELAIERLSNSLYSFDIRYNKENQE